MTRVELIALIKEELNRQCEKPLYDSPYLYAEGDETTGIDGELHIGELADAILQALNK